MLGSKDLEVEPGDSLIYVQNYRYDQVTQSGWNFWYAKGTTPDGKTVFGYNILETKGRFEDGTEVLPLAMEGSEIAWKNGNKGEYVVEGNIEKASGRLFTKGDALTACELTLDMTSLTNEITELVDHLKKEDFLHTEKHPEATFKSSSVTASTKNTYTVKGELCLRGACHPETITVKLSSSKEFHTASFEANIDRTKYGVLFASSKKPEA